MSEEKTGLEFNADILEDELLSTFGREVLERLLRCHSRKHHAVNGKMIDDSEYEKYHIVWATDDYAEYGEGFRASDHITVEHITGQYGKMIQPRAEKSLDIQRQRTQKKAEVYTPAWVCNAQNNLVDNAWFEAHGKAMREGGWFNAETDKDWVTNEKPVFDTTDGDLWQSYVKDVRMEITCGEAPYLASRYDATTGLMIEPIMRRIGLLDRKLRVVTENCHDKKEWTQWAREALMATYGFEYQGDNLLLAREALFLSTVRYFRDKFNELPDKKECERWAYYISWNLFQMDGMTYRVPHSEYEEDGEPNLFGEAEKNRVPGIEAYVHDWTKSREKGTEPFRKSVKS